MRNNTAAPLEYSGLNQTASCQTSPSANVLSNIYNKEVTLTCFSNKSSWAVTHAAQLFAKQNLGTVMQYQGEINQDLFDEIQFKLDGSTHASLLVQHIELMLEMFEVLFEPKEIGLRLIACDTSLSPHFHQPQNLVRMASTLGGLGERWVAPDEVKFLPLEPNQLKPAVKAPLPHHISQLQDGEIALMKGTQWIDHEESAITCASPTFSKNESKLCVYIDFIE